ncbi:MAG: hypothetical protein AAGE52_11890 [Myxococcota bacterium]
MDEVHRSREQEELERRVPNAPRPLRVRVPSERPPALSDLDLVLDPLGCAGPYAVAGEISVLDARSGLGAGYASPPVVRGYAESEIAFGVQEIRGWFRTREEALAAAEDRLGSIVIVTAFSSDARVHNVGEAIAKARAEGKGVVLVEPHGIGWQGMRFGSLSRIQAPVDAMIAEGALVALAFTEGEEPPAQMLPIDLVARATNEVAALDPAHAAAMEHHSRDHLTRLAGRFPDLLGDPRAYGYVAAFDLPSQAHANAFRQHVWQGVLMDIVGRAVVYRFGPAFQTAHLDRAFEGARTTLKWIEAHGLEVPEWRAMPVPPREAVRVRSEVPTRVRVVRDEAHLDAFVELEARVYEPARRDPREKLAIAFVLPGLAVIAEAEVDGKWQVVGGALGAPLEQVHGVDGPAQDCFRGANNTIYALSTTLDPAFRGHRLGERMKRALVEAAADLRGDDGALRYRYFSGRMRVGATAAMRRINEKLGATVVARYTGQYDGEGEAIYYRMPLRGPGPLRVVTAPTALGDVARRTSDLPADLRVLAEGGGLYGASVHPLSLHRPTAALLRAVDRLRSLTTLPHVAFDANEAALLARVIGDAKVAGFVEGPEVDVLLPHPADDLKGSLDALRAAVESGIETLCVETVQERTGYEVPAAFWEAASGLRILAVESAALFRTAKGAFAGTGSATPAYVLWRDEGIAIVHAREAVESRNVHVLSLLRAQHRVRALAHLDLRPLAESLDAFVAPLVAAGVPVRGPAAYRVASTGPRGGAFAARLADEGVRVTTEEGRMRVAPPLDLDPATLRRWASVVAMAWSEA